jgi:hypothetical protein
MDKGKIFLSPEEKAILEYLIILGTPSYYRAKLWLLCSGAKKELDENKNYYKNLLELSQKIPCFYENQILKDIPRTKPELLKKNPSFEKKMRNILVCYSIRNNSIGYCQGFNFIIIRLLEVLHDEVKKHIYFIIV